MGKLYQYKIDGERQPGPAMLVQLVGKGRRVLEIGCSSGSQTRVLSKDFDCEVIAVEVDPDAAELARPYCRHLIVGNIESLKVDELALGKPYDVVMFADVLEHLYDPKAVLKKVRPLIAQGGCVLASIPNVTHAALVFEMMNGRFEYRDFGLLDATHIRFFDYHGVLRLFEDSGYIVDEVDRVTISPDKTEFRVEPHDDADRFVLDYMRRRNHDSETFQFIVRAVPGDAGDASRSALIVARRRIELLEREKEDLRKTLVRRNSELEWLAGRPLRCAFERLRRTFSRRNS
jgi:2-polyprenyl-3-methyl-5-hydroxy-6-metoxy-1,4-benzoquinol methylase